MFKTVEIDNFKTFSNFSINLSKMTVIVGNNAVGKSAFLDAISLLKSSVTEGFSAYLGSNDLKVENIKNKFDKSPRISFNTVIDVDNEGTVAELQWAMVIKAYVGGNDIYLSEESVTCDDRILLSYKEGHGYQFLSVDGVVKKSPIDMKFDASCMKYLIKNKIDKRLNALISYLTNSESFALLTPENMRQSSRSKEDSIGATGRNLSSFIKRMPDDRRNEFTFNLHHLLGERV